MIWLLFLPLLCLACALLFMAVRQVGLHLASLSWVPTQGVLLERGIAEEFTPGTDQARVGAASRFTGRFIYAWEGRQYSSDQVSFSLAKSRALGGPGVWDEGLSDAMGEGGGLVSLWVNPRNPQQAVLVRDIRWMEVGFCLGLGLLLLWVSVSVLFGGPPSSTPPMFSWRTVGLMWAVGLPFVVLVPLLWRDGHPVWAFMAAIPLLLAIYGTGYGITQR